MRALALFAVLAALAALAAVGGCSTFGEEATASDAGGPPDAAAGSDAPLVDGGAQLDCGLLIDDTFSTLDPRWQLRGAATIDTDAGVASLTPDTMNQVGAIWLRVDPPVASFTAIVDFYHRTAKSPNGAEGIAIVWSGSEAVPDLGDDGTRLGICGSSDAILGIAFDETHDQIELRDSQDLECSNEAIAGKPWSSGSSTQTATVIVSASASGTAGTVQASAGSSKLEAPLPRTPPIRWIGFTASTRTLTWSQHAIDVAKIQVCR
jgi:hypothetical protein